ncbi:putative helicase mov-10-B.2 [Chanos chanos]|uniref:RNA helicase n=1 Tax=Chanos chanos TaxID=29144 RepID=A0A6J2W8M8_CHACN|nr:putative helicase mov-10-B.1 [Chanos chanos]
MSSLKDRRLVGLDFIEFLGETDRRSITDKNVLRNIYNSEFRNKDGIKDPNFSRVLYALKLSHKVRMYAGNVYFNSRVRVVLQDQWQRPRANVTPAVLAARGGSSPAPSDMGSGSASGPESRVRSRRRMAKDILDKLNKEKLQFIADKGGISIFSDHGVSDGKIRFSVENVEAYELKLFVKNTGQSNVYFNYYSALHWMNCFTFEDREKVTRSHPKLLNPGEQYAVQIKFRNKHLGVYPITVAFEFKSNDCASSKPFHIVRFIEAARMTNLASQLAPTAQFKPCRISSVKPEPYLMEDGVPPESFAVQHLKQEVPLGAYQCPPYIHELAKFLTGRKGSSLHAEEVLTSKSVLESPLNFENYAERFHCLLYLEEIQMEVDIKKYDMKEQPMVRDINNKNLLVLKVPGVAENRPSVLRGDHLLVTKSAEHHLKPPTKYKGYVHRVEMDQVKLGFSKKLLASFIDKTKFEVEFTVNRLPMRLQHRAVQLAAQHGLGDVLFPTGSMARTQESQPRLILFDRKLETNPEQYKAITNIVAGVSKPAPYLVFGPPGTGKTVTVVEAIKQVEKSQASAHILACAPSNSATDQLCEKILQHVDQNKVYRLYASSRDPRAVPLTIKDVSNLVGEIYVFPPKEELMEYKIIVTTVVTAGRLVSGGLPPGHFTHFFVDEAGHAVESEALIGVAGLLDAKSGQLVLAGDPKQLGPVLRSPLAIKYGLGISLLERLMQTNPLYQKNSSGEFDNRYVTKLLQNYRSHRAILEIPNELFYEHELQVCADEIACSSYCSWEYLPKRGFPVIFRGVLGKDDREENSPSFFNISEIEVIIDYLKKLLQSQGKKGLSKISPGEIGIITPYRKQVEKIRQAIRVHDKDLKTYMGIEKLKVGSVEEFQGQERKVIIISTVRSTKDYVKFDEDFNIGFLKNNKRFNVAATRAKALLIMVGNPIILRSDHTWARFIEYCTTNSGYTGVDCSTVEDTEEVVERLATLSIQTEPQVDTEESVIQQQMDPEWRNEQ